MIGLAAIAGPWPSPPHADDTLAGGGAVRAVDDDKGKKGEKKPEKPRVRRSSFPRTSSPRSSTPPKTKRLRRFEAKRAKEKKAREEEDARKKRGEFEKLYQAKPGV
jgi:hypothetical protein